MTKRDLLQILINDFNFEESEIKNHKKMELKSLYEDVFVTSDDYDDSAENCDY